MANVNKVILIGRLTREPETRTFASGGKVVKFGFEVTNKKKNQQTGQWEDVPMFIECDLFGSSENSRQADLALQSFHKGHQVYLEGHLVLETWEDKNGGGKRSKHSLVVENFQFLEKREDGAGGGSGGYQQRKPMASAPSRPAIAPSAGGDYYDEGPQAAPSENGGGTDEIPF